MTFSFSLYTMLILAILIAYFGSGLERLNKLELPEGGKVCCH